MPMSAESYRRSQAFADQAKQTALNRWKLETLTGLLGFRSLKHHQAESEKNQSAENAAARKAAWGDSGVITPGEDMGHTILGDVINPTPIVVNGQQSSGNGLGKVLAGAAMATVLMGIPAAGLVGFGVSKLMDKPASETDDNTLDIGLGRVEDLLPAAK